SCLCQLAAPALVWVGRVVFVLALEALRQLCYVQTLLVCLLELLAVDEADSAGSTHHRNLRGWPRQVNVSAQALGTHHAVCAAVSLAHGDGDLRNGCFTVSVK